MDELSQALKNVDERATLSAFSCGGEASGLPLLSGLEIEGIDFPIPFPIGQTIANEIKKVAQVAPFGRGMDTVIDENVRKAWEIDGEKIRITHPEWNHQVSLLVDQIVSEMECGGNVDSKIYKALLYEPGGHFQMHKDTEKVENMFATLIIQFPSKCSGGSLIVQHNASEKKYDFGQETRQKEFAYHYAAHYADVDHQVTEVTDGYRFVLTYSLFWKDDPSRFPTFETLNQIRTQSIAPITDCLACIAREKDVGYLLLDHSYTEASISKLGVNCFKGNDRVLYETLRLANQTAQDDDRVQFFIAQTTKKVNEVGIGGYSNGDSFCESCDRGGDDVECSSWEDMNCSYTIDLYDTSGSKCSYLYPKILFLDDENEDDWGEPATIKVQAMGNQAPERDTVYHRYSLVFKSSEKLYNDMNRKARYKEITSSFLHITSGLSTQVEKFGKLCERKKITSYENCEPLLAIANQPEIGVKLLQFVMHNPALHDQIKKKLIEKFGDEALDMQLRPRNLKRKAQ